MTATISVALCTFNGEAHLQAQLDSIAAQTVAPSELVVFDDRSTDRTSSVIKEFASTVGFPVRFHQNAVRLGVTANFEAAIAACNGEQIALCDQDDVWLPQKLELLSSALARSPKADIACSDATLVGSTGEPLGYSAYEWASPISVRAQLEAPTALQRLLRDRLVPGAAMLIRARLRDLAIPFPHETLETLGLLHDGWLSLLTAASGGFTVMDDRLFLYRQHDAQQTGMRGRRTPDGVVRSRDPLRPAPVAERRHRLAAEAAALASLEHELCGRAGPLAPDAEGWLRDRMTHLQRRAHMLGRPRILRTPGVIREVATGGYRRHAAGMKSVLRDLTSGVA